MAQLAMETLRMVLKLAALAAALLIAWFILFRPRRSPRRLKRKAPPPQALMACPECGVYRPPGGKCDCDPGPTSQD
jgi:hypothetical protein